MSLGDAEPYPDETTIPASCVPKAVSILVVRVLSRINLQPVEIRVDNAKLAEEFFNNLAAGRGKVEDYDKPVSDETQQAATSPLAAPATPPHMLD